MEQLVVSHPVDLHLSRVVVVQQPSSRCLPTQLQQIVNLFYGLEGFLEEERAHISNTEDMSNVKRVKEREVYTFTEGDRHISHVHCIYMYMMRTCSEAASDYG